MKAIGFTRPYPFPTLKPCSTSICPNELRPHDILVAVQAVSVNPVDVKVRAAHTPEAGAYRVLGYDAAGIVQAVGSEVRNFKVGDEVYYAGALNRQGSNAQLQAVDARIAAKTAFAGFCPNRRAAADGDYCMGNVVRSRT